MQAGDMTESHFHTPGQHSKLILHTDTHIIKISQFVIF
jgi:hypothetical protein